MLELASKLIVGFIFVLMYNLLYCKLNDKNFKIFSLRNIVIYLLATILGNLINIFIKDIFIVVFKYVLMIFMFRLLYNDKTSKIIITNVYIHLCIGICEFLFVIIFLLCLNVSQDFIKCTLLGYYFSNLAIIASVYLITNISIIKKKIKDIINWYSDKESLNSIVLSVLAIVIVSYILYQNYLEIVTKPSFMVTNMFLLGIVIFIIGYFREKTNNNKLTFKYDQLQSCIEPYGKLLNEKSKKQHEYRNQLILIRGMVKTKKARDYINKILQKEEDSEEYELLSKFVNIPNNDLNGLLHYKYFEMVKKGIKIYIDISENVNNNELKEYLEYYLNDISKILGVYLDNAIEASSSSENKYIIIEASCNGDRLEFAISNTFKGNINFNELDEEGYSLKGHGRGYGLSLVKDIINQHKEIEQYREINGMYYVQKIIVKYKNKTR